MRWTGSAPRRWNRCGAPYSLGKGSVAEDTLVLVAAVADVLFLRFRITPRDATRMALGRLHLGPAFLQGALNRSRARGAGRGAVFLLLAFGHRHLLRHRDCYEGNAYHLTTG